MGLMGSLYLGVSGLQTSQNAMNTTAHNVANIDTIGYTRQQVQQGTRFYNTISKNKTAISWQQIGLGVNYTNVKQVRDVFLDQVYRRESGRSAYYEVSYEALVHVQNLLGESGERNFSEAISDYWETIQELALDPSSAVTQGLFVSKAQTLIERATNVYKSLVDYQNNLNNEVEKHVKKLNDYAKRVVELNREIAKIEGGGVEHPNDLRDARNYILDQMAELCNISYSEDANGYVSIQIEGVDFVKGNIHYEMMMSENEYGYSIPFWPHIIESTVNADGERVYSPEEVAKGQVFNLEREISSAANTDIGKEYDKKIAPSIIMNVEAEFDRLINGIVTTVNKILGDAGYTDGTDATDNLLFVRINTEGMNAAEGWHIGNIAVNSKFLQEPALLNFVKPDDKVDQETADKLKEAFEKEIYTLNPNSEKRTNFANFYSDLVFQVANTGEVNKLLYEYQLDTQEETSFAREQVLGVSSDEELQFMIRFQNAYNVASRYISTLNSMLESMLNQFGA